MTDMSQKMSLKQFVKAAGIHHTIMCIGESNETKKECYNINISKDESSNTDTLEDYTIHGKFLGHYATETSFPILGSVKYYESHSSSSAMTIIGVGIGAALAIGSFTFGKNMS